MNGKQRLKQHGLSFKNENFNYKKKIRSKSRRNTSYVPFDDSKAPLEIWAESEENKIKNKNDAKVRESHQFSQSEKYLTRNKRALSYSELSTLSPEEPTFMKPNDFEVQSDFKPKKINKRLSKLKKTFDRKESLNSKPLIIPENKMSIKNKNIRYLNAEPSPMKSLNSFLKKKKAKSKFNFNDVDELYLEELDQKENQIDLA